MDSMKIGAFLSSQRKKKGLTQAALGERLGITDRAVSKWERGKGMPDVSLMLELCGLLGITVDELLSGEVINMENKNQKNEALLLEMAAEMEQKDKKILSAMWMIMIVSTLALLLSILAAAILIPEGWQQTAVLLGMCVLFLIPNFYALKLEVTAGAYVCKECGCRVQPTYQEALWAIHSGTTRYLKCPKCQKRTWCKKVWKKDN